MMHTWFDLIAIAIPFTVCLHFISCSQSTLRARTLQENFFIPTEANIQEKGKQKVPFSTLWFAWKIIAIYTLTGIIILKFSLGAFTHVVCVYFFLPYAISRGEKKGKKA